MSDITILSCPICNNPKLREYGNGIYQCDVCETYFDKDENIVLTEQEYLQTCDTEQLAEALLNIMANNEFTLYLLHTEKKSVQDIKCAVVEWLKQPHQD